MNPAVGVVVAIALLLVTLGFAVLRPRRMSEAVVAVPAAAAVVALGIERPGAAWAVIVRFGPTVVFLAGILLFGHVAADAGVFRYLGARAADLSRGRAPRLLVVVVAMAALVTAVLTLDATIVLLTPVILTAATSLGAAPRPHLYATVRLANSASILLPISNLTNLLAFSAIGLSFAHFTALMALPWVFVCVAEWMAVRWYFRRDLASSGSAMGDSTRYDVPAPLSADPVRRPSADSGSSRTGSDGCTGNLLRRNAVSAARRPTSALVVTGFTVSAFVVTSAIEISPAWAAFGGTAVLLGLQARAARAGNVPAVRVRRLISAASLGFCLFVLALAVIVDAAMRSGVGGALARLVPLDAGLLALLAVSFGAALLANLVNNLPATLALIPLLADRPVLMLAMLLGVNIGPNLSYAGSLATLLWRRLLPAAHRPRLSAFHGLGLVATPPILAGATVLLYLSAHVMRAL